MSGAPRVLVVEDEPRIAAAIRAILDGAGLDVCAVADTAARAEAAVRDAAPDLVLVDLGLSDRSGIDLIRALRASGFARPVLVLTSATGPERIRSALAAGADGYLFKEDLDGRLAAAMHDLARGGVPLSTGAARALVEGLRASPPEEKPPRAPAALPSLTPRERSVLELLSTGASYGEIGRELAIALNTVRSHIRSLYDALGVENRAEAVNLGWAMGLLQRAS